MKKVRFCLVIFVVISCSFYVYAKRLFPKSVTPVRLNGVEYRASVDQYNLIGCVQAIDLPTGRQLWWRQIYVIKYNPAMEIDVQDVFIKKLQPKDGKLLIENELGGTYLLDPNTLEVKCLTGKSVVNGLLNQH